MANHVIPAGEFAVHEYVMAAGVVESFVFPGRQAIVEIISDGSADIYGRSDGGDPVVRGGNTWRIPFGGTVVMEVATTGNTPSVVKLISEGTPTISVQKDT